MSGAIVVGAGCVLAWTITTVHKPDGLWRDRIDASIVADGACTHLDVRLPPGVVLDDRRGKIKYGDGGGRKLDPVRWAPPRRAADGWANVRLALPDLLVGDKVRLRIERRHTVDRSWNWTPTARLADLKVKGEAEVVAAAGVTPERGGFWVEEPRGQARVQLGQDPSPRVIIKPSRAPMPRTPAEALAEVSRRRLIPHRPDLPMVDSQGWVITPRGVVREMLRRTGLVRARVIDATHGDPVAVVAVSTEPPARVWAHPDQPWSDDWRVQIGDDLVQPVGTPAGEWGFTEDPAIVDRSMRLTLPDGADPRVALVPSKGSAAQRTDRWQFRGPTDRTRLRWIHAPAGGQITGVRVEGATASTGHIAPTADQALLIAGPGDDGVFVVQSTAPDAPTCGLASRGEVRSVSVAAVGATIEQDETGWWLAGWDEHPMATERARVIAALDARFRRRSLPEPGLPVRLRSRFRGWDLVAELPGVLRDRAEVAHLPGAVPLWPRKLYDARASRVVTPVEAALIVRAYALQAKIETDWVLVRSQGAPVGPELCAESYDAMVLRLRFDGEDRWLDPACDACAPFEIRPELLGRPALGPWATQTPPVPRGEWRVRVDGRRVTWALDGPAALELRRRIRAHPVSERKEILARWMGGDRATLVRADGLRERGVPVRLEADASSEQAIPTPIDVFTPAAGQISWPGLRIWDVVGGTRITALLDVGDTSGLQAFTDR